MVGEGTGAAAATAPLDPAGADEEVALGADPLGISVAAEQGRSQLLLSTPGTGADQKFENVEDRPGHAATRSLPAPYRPQRPTSVRMGTQAGEKSGSTRPKRRF